MGQREPQVPAPPSTPAKLGFDRARVEQLPVVGLGERPPQISEGENGGEVEQRARNIGNGQVVVDGDVRASCVVNAHRGQRTATAGDREVDGSRLDIDQPPPPRGRGVAESGIRAAVEKRGVHPAEHAQRHVPDRVDAGMGQVQPPSCAPPWDRSTSHAAALELCPADHPILARGHARDSLSGLLPPNCVAGLTAPVSEATWFGHRAEVDLPYVTRGAQPVTEVKRRGWDSNPRTERTRSTAFKAAAFDRSATPPGAGPSLTPFLLE